MTAPQRNKSHGANLAFDNRLHSLQLIGGRPDDCIATRNLAENSFTLMDKIEWRQCQYDSATHLSLKSHSIADRLVAIGHEVPPCRQTFREYHEFILRQFAHDSQHLIIRQVLKYLSNEDDIASRERVVADVQKSELDVQILVHDFISLDERGHHVACDVVITD